jgi:hypothetical protein
MEDWTFLRIAFAGYPHIPQNPGLQVPFADLSLPIGPLKLNMMAGLCRAIV